MANTFYESIKGYESLYVILKNIYEENKWSKSSVTNVIKRFVEGWKYDNISANDIDINEFKQSIYNIRKNRFDRQSKYYFVNQYGNNLGSIKFKQLQNKQAYTNSKEYKCMTDEEFEAYNKSRSVTLENLTKKYGKEIGEDKFNKYKQIQSYTKSKQRYIDENRINDFYNINKLKPHTLPNMVKRYGEKLGYEKFVNYCNNHHDFYSNVASEFFRKIDEKISIFCLNCKYAPKTSEFWIFDKNANRVYFYDFVIEELNYIIEFNGDLFHANPKVFNESDKPNPFNQKITAKDIWQQDNDKHLTAKNMNYTIDVIWETEYNKNPEYYVNLVFEKIKQLMETNHVVNS